MDLVIFVGLQAAGKSTFYRRFFGATHRHISKDLLPRGSDKETRQRKLLAEALEGGLSAVIDNTNATRESRAALIEIGRIYGARVIACFFPPELVDSLERNRARSGRARVPDVAIHATAKLLAPPSFEESFDEIFIVRSLGDGDFSIHKRRRESAELAAI